MRDAVRLPDPDELAVPGFRDEVARLSDDLMATPLDHRVVVTKSCRAMPTSISSIEQQAAPKVIGYTELDRAQPASFSTVVSRKPLGSFFREWTAWSKHRHM